MSQLEAVGSRPEFESVDLEIAVDAAHRHVTDAIRGLNAAESEEGRKYRTSDGMLVAILGTGRDGAGENATLVYRTAPPSETATRKARKVFEALESHAVSR